MVPGVGAVVMVPVSCGEHEPELREMWGVRREVQSRGDGECGRRLQVAVGILVAGQQALVQRPVQCGLICTFSSVSRTVRALGVRFFAL